MKYHPSWDGLEVVPEQEKQVRYEDKKEAVVPAVAPPLEEVSKKKRIWGLRPAVFWSTLAGGAVGGGVGGTLSKGSGDESALEENTISTSDTEPRKTNTPPATKPSTSATTTSTTSTSSAPVTSGTIGVAENPCPAANTTLISSAVGTRFLVQCSRDWPEGLAAANGTGIIYDLNHFTTYTLEDCIDECVLYNEDEPWTETPCRGVTYEANLTASFEGGQGGNCFLKDGAGKVWEGSGTTMTAGVVGS